MNGIFLGHITVTNDGTPSKCDLTYWEDADQSAPGITVEVNGRGDDVLNAAARALRIAVADHEDAKREAAQAEPLNELDRFFDAYAKTGKVA